MAGERAVIEIAGIKPIEDYTIVRIEYTPILRDILTQARQRETLVRPDE